MATVATVDGNAADGGLWLTVSEFARTRGVDKSAISRRVGRLEAQGLIETRTGPRASKLINVAQFDKAVGETTDLIRAQNGGAHDLPTPPPSAPGPSSENPVLAHQQARKASYDAELKRLDLDERLGKVLRTEDVETAMARCAAAMVRAIDQMPSRADDLAGAVARAGAAGARAELKAVAREMRDTLAREMRLLEAQGRAEHTDIHPPAPEDAPDAT